MSKRSVLCRGWLLAVALVQLGLPGAAAWADARLDAAAPRGPIHLEAQATQSCDPVHPADCVLHRFLSTPGGVVRPVPVALAFGIGQSPLLAELGRTRSDQQQRLPDSRAPPLFS